MRISSSNSGVKAKHGNEARSHKGPRFGPTNGENIGTVKGNLREGDL